MLYFLVPSIFSAFCIPQKESAISNAELFVFSLFFFFISNSLHVLIHPSSVANACNPPRQTGKGVTPLAGFLMLMSDRPLVCKGILLGFLLTLCFINLINDIYWGMLHSNQHLCREELSAVKDGTLWASSAYTWLASPCPFCFIKAALRKNLMFINTKAVSSKRPWSRPQITIMNFPFQKLWVFSRK